LPLYPLFQATDTSPRWGLPFLFAGQSQKEIFHNEAIFLIDSLVSPVAQGVADDPAVLTPTAGQGWILSQTPAGDFSGKAGWLALWSTNGWRFLEPCTGMRVFDAAANCCRVFEGVSWTDAENVTPPTGGTVIDIEARSAISELINALIAQRILTSP
jgi:hypothetical protein